LNEKGLRILNAVSVPGPMPKLRVPISERWTLLLRDDQGRLVWSTDMAPANVERSETTNAQGEIEGSIRILDSAVFSVRVPDFAQGRLTLSVDPTTLPPGDARSLSTLPKVDIGTVQLTGSAL
jgi:hypothetical protein